MPILCVHNSCDFTNKNETTFIKFYFEPILNLFNNFDYYCQSHFTGEEIEAEICNTKSQAA